MERFLTPLLGLIVAGCSLSEPGQTGNATSLCEQEGLVAVFEGRGIHRAELEPDADRIAEARGQLGEAELAAWRERARSEELKALVFGGLLDRYREDEHIDASDEEIEGFLTEVLGGDDDPELDDETTRREAESFARAIVVGWKTNRSLQDRYGGRVIFQQAGPEPFDAYRSFLEGRQAAGDFELCDPILAEEFWRYFVDDGMHVFYGAEDAAEAFATPWWLAEDER